MYLLLFPSNIQTVFLKWLYVIDLASDAWEGGVVYIPICFC